jgi:hypothetical protein
MTRNESRVRAFANQHGHTIDTSSGEVLIMAPPGQCYPWDCHERVFSPFDDETMADLWRSAAEAVLSGALDPKPCTADTCPGWEDGKCQWWDDTPTTTTEN